jgi:hypothetical protein
VPAKGTPKTALRKLKKPSSKPINQASERKAAVAYEWEQKRRDLERAREEAAKHKERERRQQAIHKAQTAIDEAEQEHAKRAASLQAEEEVLKNRSRDEDARWKNEIEKLQKTLRLAKE